MHGLQARQHQEQQWRAQQSGDGTRRQEGRRGPRKQHHGLIGQQQQSCADEGRPDELAFHLSGAGKLSDAWRDETDEADDADRAGDDRGKRNRDANGSNARALDRQTKSARAVIA